MSVMLYPCMLCVALLMCLFVLCVACLTVFVNCLVKQFAMCVGVVAILLLNVMDVFSGLPKSVIDVSGDIHNGSSYTRKKQLQQYQSFWLCIFHLKNIGPKAIEYLTTLFNDSVTSCRIPAIWKSSIVIPIPKPGKDCSLSTSYRPISLLCPAAKVMEALILTTVNTHLLPAFNKHGFRSGHITTSTLLQLTSVVATDFNKKNTSNDLCRC